MFNKGFAGNSEREREREKDQDFTVNTKQFGSGYQKRSRKGRLEAADELFFLSRENISGRKPSIYIMFIRGSVLLLREKVI